MDTSARSLDLAEKITRVLSSKVNIQILQLLSRSKLYPREIARILGKDETEISRRLNQLRKLGLIECRWERARDKNVKLCYSLVKRISFEFRDRDVYLEITTVDRRPRITRIISSTYSTNIPQPKHFIGRTRYLELLNRSIEPVVVVWGLPGAGKTYLIARYALEQDRPVLWYTASSISDLRHFLWKAMLLLNTIGYAELTDLIISELTPSIILDILLKGFEEFGVLIVIDDHHKIVDQDLLKAINYLADNIRRSKLIIISRKKPKGLPYIKGKVLEIKLSGMELREVVEYFKNRKFNIQDEELVKLYVVTQGIPVLISLYCEMKSLYRGFNLEIFRKRNIISYIINEIYSSLNSAEKRIFDLLVLVDEPIEATIIRDVTDIGSVEYILNSFITRGFVEAIGETQYVIHDIFRIMEKRIPAEKKKAIYSAIARHYFSRDEPFSFYKALLYFYKSRDLDGIRDVLKKRIYGDLDYHMFFLNKYISILRDIEDIGINDLRLAMLLKYEIGHIKMIKGEFDEAISILSGCLRYIEPGGTDNDKYLYVQIATDLAEAYANKGLLDKCWEYLHDLPMVIDSITTKSMKNILLYHYLGSLGLYYYYRQDYRKALDAYLKRLEISRNIDDPKYYIFTLIGVANLYEALSENERALNILMDLHSYLSKTDSIVKRALTESIIADTLTNLRRYSEAVKYIDKAIEVFERLGIYGRLAGAYMLKAYCMYKLGDLGETIRYCDNAIELFGDTLTCEKANAIAIKIYALLITGDYENAIANLKENINFIRKCISFGTIGELVNALKNYASSRGLTVIKSLLDEV